MSVESLGPKSLFSRSDFLVELPRQRLQAAGIFDDDGWPCNWPGSGILEGRRFLIGLPHSIRSVLSRDDPDLFAPADAIEIRLLMRQAQQKGIEAADLRYWADETPPSVR